MLPGMSRLFLSCWLRATLPGNQRGRFLLDDRRSADCGCGGGCAGTPHPVVWDRNPNGSLPTPEGATQPGACSVRHRTHGPVQRAITRIYLARYCVQSATLHIRHQTKRIRARLRTVKAAKSTPGPPRPVDDKPEIRRTHYARFGVTPTRNRPRTEETAGRWLLIASSANGATRLHAKRRDRRCRAEQRN